MRYGNPWDHPPDREHYIQIASKRHSSTSRIDTKLSRRTTRALDVALQNHSVSFSSNCLIVCLNKKCRHIIIQTNSNYGVTTFPKHSGASEFSSMSSTTTRKATQLLTFVEPLNNFGAFIPLHTEMTKPISTPCWVQQFGIWKRTTFPGLKFPTNNELKTTQVLQNGWQHP